MTSKRKLPNSSDDFLEYMANCNELNNLHTVTSSDDDSSDEVKFIRELKVNPEDHRCDLCCEGEFLVDKLLRFGGIIDSKYKFVCDKCDENFIYKSELSKHLSNCSGPVFNWNKTFNESISKNSKQQSSPPIVCTVCNQTFKSKGGLTHHTRSKHSDQVHVCEICKKVFSSFKEYQHHCNKHEREKHFKRKKKQKKKIVIELNECINVS